MSKINKNKNNKNNKININFYSTGKFLNLNKPKFLSLNNQSDKSIKNKVFNTNNHNISQDISPFETITKITENNSKDEIIKALKDRITILENKVKLLEKENNEKISNVNEYHNLNLSNDTSKNIEDVQNKKKLNLKLFKKDKKIKVVKFINISKSSQKENNKLIINNSFNNFNNINKNLNKKNNFLNIFNINNNLNNYNNLSINNYKTISNSENKNTSKKIIIIPKKKLFQDFFNKSLIKFSSIDINNNKIKGDKLKNEFDKNIPKIPIRKKYSHKSIIIKNKIDNYKYNESTNSPEIKMSYSEKKNELKFNISNGNKKSSNIKEFNFECNNNNNNKFDNIKNKLESIKFRTKNLLEFYSSNNINNDYIDNNIDYKKLKLNDIVTNKDFFINTNYN